jgi:hypothetical protein
MFMRRLRGQGVSGASKPRRDKCGREVIRAVVVISRHSEQLVAITVARRHEGVMDAARGILQECRDGLALVGQQ